MQIVRRNVADLIFAEYNPRQMTEDQRQSLTDSIKRFGIVDPILVNSSPDRKNIIVGGHQRIIIAKELSIEEVPTVELNLSLEKEKELNVRLNRNTGEWDWDALANYYEIEDLTEWGFDEKELVGDIKEEKIDPELEISPELFERHDYIVFYFENEFDWQVASEKFDLKQMKTAPIKQKSVEQKGVGRLLPAKELLNLF